MPDEIRILVRQRGVTARTLVSVLHAIRVYPASAPTDVHPSVHEAGLRGLQGIGDDLRIRIQQLDGEIQAALATALWEGMGIGTHPTVARRRAAPDIP